MTACQLQDSAVPMVWERGCSTAILQRDPEKVNLPRPVRKGLIFVKKFGIMKQKETVVFYII